MNQDLRQLEGEVEAMLATWSEALDVQPPPGTRDRLRATVGRQLNEAWLTDQPSPSPAPATLDRVRRAVRDELHRESCGWAGMLRRWQLRIPAAAAAAIVIVMGLAYQAGWLSSGSRGLKNDPPGTQYVSAEDPLSLFVEASNRVWAADSLTAAISTDLDNLEDGLSRTRTASDGVQDTLDDIGDRIDDLFDSGPIDTLGRLESIQAGALG